MEGSKVSVKDGIVTVTIGGQMQDWQKHELIMKFRREFASSNVVIRGVGVNLSGEATMGTRF